MYTTKPMNILVSMVPISGEGSDPPSGRLSDPPRSPMRMAENFVAVAKLAEFGSTVKLKDGNDVLHQPSGTPGYSGKERIHHTASSQWAMGASSSLHRQRHS